MTDVHVGQIWVDNDRRSQGRKIIIEKLYPEFPIGDNVKDNPLIAECRIIANPNSPATIGNVTRIRVSRLRPTASGYTLISERA